jgi:transposase
MSYKIAGIDVHKKVLMVVVMDASTPESKPERRRFTTMPSDLRRLLLWLREQGVEEAVMESTAQYWRSVWLELEPYMRLQLAQAFSNRAPRGRKHDFKDAERLVRRLGSLFAMEKANIEIPEILLNRPMLGSPNARNPYDFFITI